MGFSAKQVQALRRKLDHRHIHTREAHGRELSYIEGWYAISEANRIFGFDGGIGRQLNPAASSLGKTVVPSSPSIPPGYGFRCMPEVQPSFEKATDRVKAVGPRPVRCTIPRSRQQKPTPPNARWRLSENRSGLSSIARKRTHRCNARQFSQPATASPPTQPRLGFHPDDTTPIPRPSHYYGRRHQSSHD